MPRTRTPSPPVPVVLVAALGMLSAGAARAVTRFDCDRPGTPYEASQLGVPPGPACLPGGPTGSYLRLADTTVANINSVSFDLSDPGAHGLIVADFDFRMTPHATDSRADGFGFALASTAAFGASGPVAGHSEEANVVGSLGVGFDIHQGPGESSNDHVSIHWQGSLLREIDVTRVLDLAAGQFTHARIIARPGAFPPDLTILLTPCGSPPVTVVDRLPIPGLIPYEARVHLMARSGGEAALHDIDNLNVQFLSPGQCVLSFAATNYEATEVAGGEAVVTVTRAGSLAGAVTVDYSTADLSATAGADYTPASGTLRFASGEEEKTLRVPIRDDDVTEGGERFLLRLESPSGGAALGGPDQAQVTIVDDETARTTGHWSGVMCWPIVAIHALALPDGRVMMWSRGEGMGAASTGDDAQAWDPATGEMSPLARAGYDIFCSGHTLAADGRVLLAGGHITDEVGLARASLYDPARDAWTSAPDMNAGRWYPTTTVLANGDLLVTSGSIDSLPTMNEIPQVLNTGAASWRDLSGARITEKDLSRFYPWLFVAPGGRVFCAGKEQNTWYLDTRDSGSWTPGAASHFGRRDYGSAVMYEPGKVLIVGGNPRESNPASQIPTASAEVIDLTAATPAWRDVAPMGVARRQLNATLLPDGTVLATGGTSAPGFNDAAAPALAAEQWDPSGEAWTTLASMTIPRLYHSIALLLPDGRVLSAGGGFPPATHGGLNRADAEIFSPPYLYKGPRPVITSAPVTVSYGEAFEIETPDAAGIATVRWIRLASVTHSFDQSQRSNVLEFTTARSGLYATAPLDSTLCPPGHYLLYILNREGVPSVGRVVQVTRAPGGVPLPGTRGPTLSGARPNPATHGLRIAFALPNTQPAELTVFDLGGRRILSRDVGGLGPGEHVVDVGPESGLKPGVYMIRLTQAGQSVAKQAIVLQP